ncbi:TauD/TfdA family dioxygenase [Belnapia sp. T18]|uniref:TauD/TfdA family dioxygenase n=1 Tax=Belnapia arida TaxID=2804533 RepID=A0ABS1TXQ3_9PROT|nr:TauD/TfdA family dioxygenase [Belnapia arida]MBL6076464.1 TauD/TfdA family dioxygenase [Belnapia arida]
MRANALSTLTRTLSPDPFARSHAPMQIHPLHPAFAAEVAGLDLATPLDAPTLEVLHDAFLEHAVLLFRGQRLSPAAQSAFAAGLAAVEAPLLDRRSLLLPPPLRVVAGIPEGEAPPGAAWHADHTHDAEPSLACLAHAPAAEATEIAFADQRAALALLPASLRRRVEELRAEHAHHGRLAEHPVIRSHPVTGEGALFVNPAFTRRILNLPAGESARLLDALFAAATAPAVTWRHAWRPGDLILWDNRTVLHTGTAADALQRVRIEGDRPLGLRALEMPWVVAG